MARRRQPPKTSHRPKSRKRPREYHHGRTQGKVNEKKIKRALPAFERAEADMAEVAATAAATRAEIADRAAMIEAVVHVSPALYAPFA